MADNLGREPIPGVACASGCPHPTQLPIPIRWRNRGKARQVDGAHEAVGLDGSQQFVAMARSHSQCEVLYQDFLAMQLPESQFDGIFANASLFHVPSQELQRVLLELFQTLNSRGVLFSSNPRGNNEEGFTDDRYACFFDLDTWRDYVTSAGFEEEGHYYLPPGLPRHKQPWLAPVWPNASPPRH